MDRNGCCQLFAIHPCKLTTSWARYDDGDQAAPLPQHPAAGKTATITVTSSVSATSNAKAGANLVVVDR